MRRRLFGGLAVLAVVVGVATALRMGRALADANAESVELAAYLAQMTNELKTTRADSDLLVEILAVLESEDLRRGSFETDRGDSRMLVGRRGFVLLMRDFPQPAPGHALHVWLETRAAGPASVGTFRVNPFGLATVARIVSIPAGARVLVTEEPQGGLPASPSEPLLRSDWW